MPALKTYDLFISHAWAYNQAYYKLIDLLDTAPNLYFRNYSVPGHDPVLDPNSNYGRDKLTRALDAQIRPVNCVVIISGMYATYRYWIDKEIEIAKRYSREPTLKELLEYLPILKEPTLKEPLEYLKSGSYRVPPKRNMINRERILLTQERRILLIRQRRQMSRRQPRVTGEDYVRRLGDLRT